MLSVLKNNLPILIIIGLLLIIGSVLSWHVWESQKRFIDYQHAIMEQSVQGAATEVTLLIDKLRTSLALLADKNQQSLQQLAQNPNDERAYARISGQLSKYFPAYHAFTLSNDQGELFYDDLGERIGETCRSDLRAFATRETQADTYIHPGPERHHFDVMQYLEYETGESGVFFVSFESDPLTTLLRNSQVAGHRLFLVRADIPDLIEISAEGGREEMERDIRLEPAELKRIAHQQAVEQTRWNLVDLPAPDLFRSHLRRNIEQSVILFVGLLLLSMVSVLLLKREEKRRLEAEAALVESLQSWTDTLEKRVGEQVGQLERLGRLKQFLSPEVAEVVVSSGDESALQSHRREIAVVFCDLRGFTDFAESVEPEDSMRVLGAYHEAMGEIIGHYHGNINHRAGDGMMVIFNDPLPCEEPAVSAVRMSVAMRDRMDQLIGRWRSQGYALGFGIGISYGYATLGLVGHYTAIGSVVNLASRLCDEAQSGQILVTQRVQAEVESLVNAELIGQRTFKGFSRPINVFNVSSLREAQEQTAET